MDASSIRTNESRLSEAAWIRARPDVGRVVGKAVIGVSTVFVLSLLLSRIGYIPMWDGRIYADCITRLASAASPLGDLRCAQHVTHAYMLYSLLVQKLAPESFAPMLLASTILYAAACVAFYRLVSAAFPAEEHRLDRALLTAGFVVQPALLASVVQPGIDLPLVPAFLWCAVFALRRQWIAMVVVGTAMVFTKETGVVLYAVLIFTYAVCFVLVTPARSVQGPSRLRGLLRLVPLALPLVAFVGYVAMRFLSAGESAVWTATPTNQSLVSQFLVPRIDRRLVTSVIVMGVLSFAWIPTAVIAADVVRWIGRRVRGEVGDRPVPGGDPQSIRFLFVLTVIVGLVLLRLAPYSSVRYALVPIALVPIPFYAALVRLGFRPGIRRAVVVLWVVALATSIMRTTDPVSRALFGTWQFGERSLLRMTRITGECCGAGRDQLVYNLQFTELHSALDDALHATRIDDSTTLFVPSWMTWFTIGSIDPSTHRRTLRRSSLEEPRVLEPDSLGVSALPAQAWFLGLPNGDVATSLKRLESAYRIGPPTTVGSDGYFLSAYPLTLRDVRP